MASLERRNQTYRVVFMYAGRKYSYSLDTGNREMAEALRGGVEKTLMLLDQKLLHLPEGADLVDFIRNGGQVTAPPPPVVERLALTALKQRYLEAHGQGALEQNSLSTMAMHLGHFERTLGGRFTVQDLALADLQRHVNARAQKKYRGRKLSPVTLKKEIASLRAAWNWSAHLGLVHGTFPNKGLVYPKTDEKPPFMTWPEIERKLAGLPEHEQAELWECLFLTQPEVAELLEHVKVAATHPWIYPALVFVAHTGVRRSEMLRVKVQDLDLVAGSVLIREKKRTRGRRTHRRVPLSSLLTTVLRDWLAVHPGGPYLFCHRDVVARSKKRSRTTGHQGQATRASSLKGRMAKVRPRERPGALALTKDEAHDHFQRTIVGSKWAVLRGWHLLRHSFISNCAAQGVDQRLIDSWVGHTTEEMRNRYRHLIPNVEQKAIQSVFG